MGAVCGTYRKKNCGAYRVLVKEEKKGNFGRPRIKWENNFNVDLK